MLHRHDLRDYQHRTAAALYKSPGIIGVLPMGAGKTAAALTAIVDLIDDQCAAHALILAPKRVAEMVWPDEIGDWMHAVSLNHEVLVGPPGKRTERLHDAGRRDVTICSVDNTQWLCGELEKMPANHPIFDVLVLDEISRFRNPKSKRAKALLRIVRRFKRVWGLTGTPRPNGLEDLFKPLALVSREKLWGRSFYAWRQKRFYPTDRNGYNWAILPQWEEPTIREAGTLMFALSEDDMPTLPDVSIIEHRVRMPETVFRQYRKMQRELVAELANRDILAATAGVAASKLSQMASGFIYGEGGNTDVEHLHTAKADWVVEMVEDMAGSPVIIIYEFVEDLRVLQSLFGADLPYLGQGVSTAEARFFVDQWNSGALPILAMHAASGGHGLNLQFGGHQMIWYGLTWSSELFDQTVARIARPGQGNKVFIHVCLADGTIDELKRLRVVAKMTAEAAFKAWLATV